MTRVNDCRLSIYYVENMNKTTHFVYFCHLTLVNITSLQLLQFISSIPVFTRSLTLWRFLSLWPHYLWWSLTIFFLFTIFLSALRSWSFVFFLFFLLLSITTMLFLLWSSAITPGAGSLIPFVSLLFLFWYLLYFFLLFSSKLYFFIYFG